MAWMGVAAINIKELTSQLEEGYMRKFQGKLMIDPDNMHKRKIVLIIDEMSMITPTILAVLYTRLKQATGLEKNFGVSQYLFSVILTRLIQ
eukprot:11448668-Ditylum_brightwellii.AAC.1